MMFEGMKEKIMLLERRLDDTGRRLRALEGAPSPWLFLPRETAYIREAGGIKKIEFYRLTKEYDPWEHDEIRSVRPPSYQPGDVYYDGEFHYRKSIRWLTDEEVVQFKAIAEPPASAFRPASPFISGVTGE